MDQSQEPTQMDSLLADISNMTISNPSTPKFPASTHSPKRLHFRPYVTLITMLTAMLYMFYHEGKSPREIDDYFLAQGKFFTLGFIQSLFDAGAYLPETPGPILSDAEATEYIEARLKLICFILWSCQMGKSKEDIGREWRAANGWQTGTWFVSDLLMYGNIHKGD